MRWIRDIVEQHPEEAAFLWLLRRSAVAATNYDLGDLTELDERIDAHLDALRVVGDEGWRACLDALDFEEPGEVFAAGVGAFESGKEDRIRTVIEMASSSGELRKGLASALGWLPAEISPPHIRALLASGDPKECTVGMSACAVNRTDPGGVLATFLGADDPALRARALRAVGELGRHDLLPKLMAHLMAEDEDCRFAACWATALLGDMTGVGVLKSFAGSERYAERAMRMVSLCMPRSAAHSWCAELFSDPAFARLAVFATGAAGDPIAVPWLIEQMAVPEFARAAGQALVTITGVDLDEEKLEGSWPEGFEAGPTENPEDEDVAIDRDEDLPWPDAERVEQWWGENRARFEAGRSYLAGKPAVEESLRESLREGFQDQRGLAALRLALLAPGRPLFEVRAPGFKQRGLVGN
ncbi:MAG: TIGR02270 family protein [Deferrisomatales bacterium]|nr:TIGR02270 family protein [Deferrisomatales bacterium]